jgi:cytochrome oxidase Cu insertion factor (SCO1/SenC/PrrC family)
VHHARRARHARPNRVTAALCALLVAALFASCGAAKSGPPVAAESRTEGSSASHFAGATLPLEHPRDFTLTDQSGRRASLSEYRGRPLVLAFLDARCGAPCIVIAEQIRGALDQLTVRAPVLFVTIDPASDSPSAAARFLARVALTGRARYLTGALATLRTVWSAYRVPAPAPGSSVFDRFAPVVLLDREGRARVAYALEGLTPESLAHDIRVLAQ